MSTTRRQGQRSLEAVANWTVLVSSATRPILTTFLEALRAPTQRAWMVGMHRAHPESAELLEVADEVEVMTAVIQSWSTTPGGGAPGAAHALPRAAGLSAMNLAELRAEAQRMGFDITSPSLRTKAQLYTAIKEVRGAEAPKEKDLKGLSALRKAEIQELCEARGLSSLGTKDEMKLRLQGWTLPPRGTASAPPPLPRTATSSTQPRRRAGPQAVPLSPISPTRVRAPGAAAASPSGLTAPTCPVCNVPFLLKKNGRDASLFWGCAMFPQCRRTMPLEAAEVLAPSPQPENAPDVEEAWSRMRQMETELLQQRAQLEWQQDHVAMTAMAQQQQQEVLAAAGSRLAQEQAAMEMGRAPGTTMPGHLPPAGSPMVISPHERDVDLSATP